MRAPCLFEHRIAGYLTADGLSGKTVTCDFEPVRSVAHLRLVKAG